MDLDTGATLPVIGLIGAGATHRATAMAAGWPWEKPHIVGITRIEGNMMVGGSIPLYRECDPFFGTLISDWNRAKVWITTRGYKPHPIGAKFPPAPFGPGGPTR